MELVNKADDGCKKWRVRYAIGETLSQFSKYLSQETVVMEILPIYLQFLQDKEKEIKSISVQALPNLCGEVNEEGEIIKSYLQDKHLEKIIVELKKISKDVSNHVKISLSEVLFKVS